MCVCSSDVEIVLLHRPLTSTESGMDLKNSKKKQESQTGGKRRDNRERKPASRERYE